MVKPVGKIIFIVRQFSQCPFLNETPDTRSMAVGEALNELFIFQKNRLQIRYGEFSVVQHILGHEACMQLIGTSVNLIWREPLYQTNYG